MPRTKRTPARKSRNGTFGSGTERTGRSEVYVTRTLENGPRVLSEKEERNLIAVHRFVTEPARVGVEVGLTLNLHNYEFAKINVSVSIPCYKEEIDETYRYAQSWAKARLQTEVAKARQEGEDARASVEVAAVQPAPARSNGTTAVEHPF